MKDQDIIMATRKELKKLHIVKMVMAKKISQVKAANLLGLSTRQIRRIQARLAAEGDKAIVHGLRARSSNSKKPDSLRKKILSIYSEKYSDFGPTLASEKLATADGISITKETLRLWLIDAGLHTNKRKARPHRSYRKRSSSFGQMVQLDGSTHYWFEGRGPLACFMGYIDDATNNVFGRFYTHEGTFPAMDCFYRYSREYGLPLSIYLDRHSTYRSTRKASVEEELLAKVSQSHFQRALTDLGVRMIYANSPQAKGRIERLFKTLQDRLIKELRLEGISSIDDANEFLSSYLRHHNTRFSITPIDTIDLHRKTPKDIKDFLCLKYKRVLRNDNTISYKAGLYQVLDTTSAKKVDVCEYMDGRISIRYKGVILKHEKVDKVPFKLDDKKPRKERVYIKPRPDHPWRGKMKGRGVLASKLG